MTWQFFAELAGLLGQIVGAFLFLMAGCLIVTVTLTRPAKSHGGQIDGSQE